MGDEITLAGASGRLESFDRARAVKAQNPINDVQECGERRKCQAPSASDLPDLGKLG